jgi:DnaJ-class molecular chaperone
MNLYNLLGITSNATRQEVNSAYRKFAIKHHPDRSTADEAPCLFTEYSKAYEILSDPRFRAVYDKFGHKGLADIGWSATDPATVFFNFFGSNNPFDYLLPLPNAIEFTRLTKPDPSIPNAPLKVEFSSR